MSFSLPFNLGDLGKLVGVDPSKGYEIASQGAAKAQAAANQLSDLQWARQMQGLQLALNAAGNRPMHDQLYGTRTTPGQATPGGSQLPWMSGGPPGSAAGSGGMSGPDPSGVRRPMPTEGVISAPVGVGTPPPPGYTPPPPQVPRSLVPQGGIGSIFSTGNRPPLPPPPPTQDNGGLMSQLFALARR